MSAPVYIWPLTRLQILTLPRNLGDYNTVCLHLILYIDEVVQQEQPADHSLTWYPFHQKQPAFAHPQRSAE